MRMRTLAVTLLLAAFLGACSSDYTALRDWSQQAREAVLPADVPRAAPMPAHDAAMRPVGSRQDAVLVLQEAAAAWLAALAAMADDVPPPPDGAELRTRAERVAVFDPEGAAAVESLGDAIDYVAAQRWGAPQLAYAVDFGDARFQAVMAALARQTEALGANAASRALGARIAEGHALLKRREAILAQSDTSRLLRAEASELRRLRAVASAASPAAGVPPGPARAE